MQGSFHSSNRPPHITTDLSQINIPHRLFLDILDERLCLSTLQPDSRPIRVLDLGTGDGDWAIAFSKRHPRSSVIATDICPLPASLDRCRFEHVDFNSAWPRWAAPFHLIHGRMLGTSISNLQHFFRQAFQTLYPGGSIEMQDVCFLPKTDPDASVDNVNAQTLKLLSELMRRAAESQGIALDRPHEYRSKLAECGFADVEVRQERWPIGPWSSDPRLRLFGPDHAMRSIKHASSQLLGDEYGMCKIRLDDFLRNVQKAFKDRSIKPYFELWDSPAGRPQAPG